MSRNNLLAACAAFLLLQGVTTIANAQIGDPNSQLLCYTVPVNNPRFSPGLNRGAAEDEWIVCQAVINGSSFDVADEYASDPGDGLFDSFFVVPTYTANKPSNGISNIAFEGTFGGAGTFTDTVGGNHGDSELPAGHPALTTDICGTAASGCLLGAFGDGDPGNQATVTPGAREFLTGPSLFSGGVTGVRIPVNIDFTTAPEDRIDLFFAIRLARDGLKAITDQLSPANHQQDFPGTDDSPPGLVDGAGQWFSGPGPLWIGFYVGDPTGIATVPIKVLEGGTDDVASQSTVAGEKYCDADEDGSCSEEDLFDGTTVTVSFCLDPFGDEADNACDDPQSVTLVTGANCADPETCTKYSSATVTIRKATSGPPPRPIGAEVTPNAGSAGAGEWELFFDRLCDGNNSDGGGPLTLTIEETLDSIFNRQTAPQDDADDSDGVTAAGGVYTVLLGCSDESNESNIQLGLDFGNVLDVFGTGDPHTIGYWGANIIKAAINSDDGEGGASGQCGDQAPGNNVLPKDGYETPAEVADLIQGAVAECAAFDNVPEDDSEALCYAANMLPPKHFENAPGQLLGVLLNIESGLLPEGFTVDLNCLLGTTGQDPVDLDEIVEGACADPDAYHDILAALNELDPEGGVLTCLYDTVCPMDELDPDGKNTGQQCSLAP